MMTIMRILTINDDHDDDEDEDHDGSYEDDNGVGANETNCPLTFVKSKQRISFESQRKKGSKSRQTQSAKMLLPNKSCKMSIFYTGQNFQRPYP